jgi:O-antigen ligase
LRQIAFYGFAIYMLITYLLRRPRDGVYILMALVAGGTLFGASLSFNTASTWDPLVRIEEGRGAPYLLLGSTEQLGPVLVSTYLSTLLPIAAALSLYPHPRRGVGLLFAAATALLSLLLLASEGRGGWIAGIASVLTVLILGRFRQQVSWWKGIMVVAFAGAVLFAVISSGMLSITVLDRLATFGILGEDSGLATRQVLWQMAWRMLTDNPLGVGFSYFFGLFGLTVHNELLQVGLGSGFLGMFCFIAFYLGVVRKCLVGLGSPDLNIRTVCIAALVCCVTVAINGITDNPSTNSLWTWPAMWIVMATAMGVLRNTDVLRASTPTNSSL